MYPTNATFDIHPETIDIEQPSFASRQYIVAYQVNAILDICLVPVLIQQPILYSAYASLENENEPTGQKQRYTLQRDATASNFKQNNAYSPDPIIINVAAGLDSDYWWITAITMSSALIGGLLLTKSLDSVSIWS